MIETYYFYYRNGYVHYVSMRNLGWLAPQSREIDLRTWVQEMGGNALLVPMPDWLVEQLDAN